MSELILTCFKVLETWQAKRKSNGKGKKVYLILLNIEITWKQIVFQNALTFFFFFCDNQEWNNNFYNESMVAILDTLTAEKIPWVYLSSLFSYLNVQN